MTLRSHLVLGAFALTCGPTSALAQEQLYGRIFGRDAQDRMLAAAPDGVEGVYVCGEASVSFGGTSAGLIDAYIGRFDPTGVRMWRVKFGTSGEDATDVAAPDGVGGVIAGGRAAGMLPGSSTSGPLWLARYDANGGRLWLQQFGSADETLDTAAPDGAGGVIVGGSFRTGAGPGTTDAWIVRYDAAGTRMWRRELGTAGIDRCLGAAPDGSGGFFVCGRTDGTWSSPTGAPRQDDDAWLARYDGSGTQMWIEQFGTSDDDSAEALATDGVGGVFVTGIGDLDGTGLGETEAFVARYDGAGTRQWTRVLTSTGRDEPTFATADDENGVYVGGLTTGDLGTFGDPAGGVNGWAARITPTGNVFWVRQYRPSPNAFAWTGTGDGLGGLIVGGQVSFGSNLDLWFNRYAGTRAYTYCSPAVSNSTGAPGAVSTSGSTSVAANDVTLRAESLPTGSFGLFIVSRSQGFVPRPGGSRGNLCLGGDIGRFVGPGEILSSGTQGSFALTIDLARIPTPSGFDAAQPGDTWNFQAWHRDADPAATSNFTDAVSVQFGQ